MRKTELLQTISRKLFQYSMLLFLLLGISIGLRNSEKTMAAEKILTQISAVYIGGAVEVGESIDTKNLIVTAYYAVNGNIVSETVKSGYQLSPPQVVTIGDNTILVIYKGYTAKVKVVGKMVTKLSATYTGPEVTVGNDISAGNINVIATYSDMSTERLQNFELPLKKITTEGDNTFVVSYKGVNTSLTVKGKAVLAVDEIIAYYVGGEVISGTPIDKSQVIAYAVYNNGAVETIKQFNLSPATVTKGGINTIELSFGGRATTIQVPGIERTVVSMKAEYIGLGVIIGQTVDKNEVKVMATYNDGTTERTQAFFMTDSLISAEGDNVVLVYCGEMADMILVPGVKGFSINYNNAISCIFFGDADNYTTTTLALNANTKKDSFSLLRMDKSLVDLAVRRVINTENYIPFQITYDDDEMIKEFPMAMKVTRPAGYEADKFGVYYTPNQRTIMAKLNGEYLDEAKKEYQFLVYEPGTYVLVREVENLLVKKIEVAEELDVKAKRNYSLKPVVLPASAENKKVTYWSDDEEIATVNENGKIQTYKEGVCNIWIEATDGSEVKAIVQLNVSER